MFTMWVLYMGGEILFSVYRARLYIYISDYPLASLNVLAECGKGSIKESIEAKRNKRKYQ